jgi:hypothetical protein
MLGAGLSAFSIGVYQLKGLNDPLAQQYLRFYTNLPPGRNFIGQGGIQAAGTFISFGIAIAFGILAGLLINLFYKKTYIP